MKTTIFIFFVILLWGCSDSNKKSAFDGSAPVSATAAVGTIPDESIYLLADTFQTQDSKPVTLASFSGKPTVIGMIFTHCDFACPRLTADIKNIEQNLSVGEGKINYLLISFDTKRDTPEQLKKYAGNLNLDNDWTLLHGSEDAIRTLSILLNVQFVKDAEGNFSHSNIISVLDKSGMLLFQKEGLEANHENTISMISDLMK